ncbi:MAG: hypothetical protein ABSE69_06440 [Roseiarcus sp.]|jgi:hypothetical protein
MTGSEIVSDYRDDLAKQIARRDKPPALQPLPISPWVAMALLQKAVRRGRGTLALQAAATLLVDARDRLWRRCGGIAFEDIGIANPDVLGLVTVALGSKRIRGDLGGEWAVASIIVEAMANANKCRAADDLLMSVELHPAFAEARQAQAELSNDELRQIVLNSGVLHKRALALWFLLGTDRRPSRHLAVRRGQPALAFDVLRELGTPPTMVEIAREGFRKTGEVLCPFVALLFLFQPTKNSILKDDDFPPEIMIGEIPSWALDVYSREGRAAYARFLQTESASARWMRGHVAPGRQVGLLGHVVFRLEGGLVRNRLRWKLADELRRQVDVDCAGLGSRDALEILELVNADIPILNEVRAKLNRGLRHD